MLRKKMTTPPLQNQQNNSKKPSLWLWRLLQKHKKIQERRKPSAGVAGRHGSFNGILQVFARDFLMDLRLQGHMALPCHGPQRDHGSAGLQRV